MLVHFLELGDMAKGFLILMNTITRFSLGEKLFHGVCILLSSALVGSFFWLQSTSLRPFLILAKYTNSQNQWDFLRAHCNDMQYVWAGFCGRL